MRQEATTSHTSVSVQETTAGFRYSVRIEQILAALALVLCGSWFAYKQAFSQFQHYDDEGLMLIMLRHYMRYGGLYSSTFTQYGPFQVYIHEVAHVVLGIPVTHDGGRIVMLIFWIGAAILATVFLYALTRQVVLSAAVFFLTLTLSIVLRYEPGHPQQVILFLTELGFCLSLRARGRVSKLATFLIGAIAACLILTKLNVGVFYAAAAFFSFVALMSPGRLRTLLLTLGCPAAILMPVLIMRTHLHAWAWHYCLLATACIAIFVLTISAIPTTDPWRPAELWWPVAGFLAGLTLILGVALLSISPNVLLEGLLLPVTHAAGFFFIPLKIPSMGMAIAGASSMLSVLVWKTRDRLAHHPDILGMFKIVVGLATIGILLTHILATSLVALPLIPLAYLQASGRPQTLNYLFPRVLLCGMIIFQFLQAFPVKGSHVHIALTPAMAWAFVLVFDGYRHLETVSGTALLAQIPALLRLRAVSAVLTMCFSAAILVDAEQTHFADYESGPTLDLPGSTRIHVSSADAKLYSQLVADIRENCDVLLTMPGMYSLNLWSERPTPNGMNWTGWMTTLSEKQQRETLERLRKSPRPCVAYNRGDLAYWMPMGEDSLEKSPLGKYVATETVTIARVADYELRVPVTERDRDVSTHLSNAHQ